MPRKTASLPSSQTFFRGPMVGWRPNSSLRRRTWSAGMPRLGRKSRYRPLVYGITVFRPSLPPDRDSTTKTLSFEAIARSSVAIVLHVFQSSPAPEAGRSLCSAELELSSRREHLEHLATLAGEVGPLGSGAVAKLA